MKNFRFSFRQALLFTVFTFLLISLLSIVPDQEAMWNLIVKKMWIAILVGIAFGFFSGSFGDKG
jgi:uncharacterized membrane protein YraQ (UPF0718 family)